MTRSARRSSAAVASESPIRERPSYSAETGEFLCRSRCCASILRDAKMGCLRVASTCNPSCVSEFVHRFDDALFRRKSGEGLGLLLFMGRSWTSRHLAPLELREVVFPFRFVISSSNLRSDPACLSGLTSMPQAVGGMEEDFFNCTNGRAVTWTVRKTT
ncbi:hypothetical protein AXG93_841s1010 [Marchantia polymorpha subsp. ruderalis]|uniref:Uncharacterized protein n=1 Tax=Marchantia polymorpha subsp. ruderalis TaxID=1480154 RepID=A0A176WE98_MARPO|nr:hypothetical protein AXG93_841s1010 [Marchantia polymorpha subsp. ruderalis]